MSLFSSLSLINEVRKSISPRSQAHNTVDVSSAIKFNSPRAISEATCPFTFAPLSTRQKSQGTLMSSSERTRKSLT